MCIHAIVGEAAVWSLGRRQEALKLASYHEWAKRGLFAVN
jgi:hypothetical protein